MHTRLRAPAQTTPDTHARAHSQAHTHTHSQLTPLTTPARTPHTPRAAQVRSAAARAGGLESSMLERLMAAAPHATVRPVCLTALPETDTFTRTHTHAHTHARTHARTHALTHTQSHAHADTVTRRAAPGGLRRRLWASVRSHGLARTHAAVVRRDVLLCCDQRQAFQRCGRRCNQMLQLWHEALRPRAAVATVRKVLRPRNGIHIYIHIYEYTRI